MHPNFRISSTAQGKREIDFWSFFRVPSIVASTMVEFSGTRVRSDNHASEFTVAAKAVFKPFVSVHANAPTLIEGIIYNISPKVPTSSVRTRQGASYALRQ